MFAHMCIVDFARVFPGGRVTILVPTLALLDQWFVSVQEDLGVAASEIATFSGEGKASKAAPINLMVLNTARQVPIQPTDDAPTFLIVDECHRAASPQNSLGLAGRHAATLGISATPEREFDEELETYLVPTLGSVIYRYTYADALTDGVIIPFDLVNVRFALSRTEQSAYDRLSQRVARTFQRIHDQGMSDDGLKRLLRMRARVSSTARLRVPLAAKIVEDKGQGRSLVFHEQINAADEITKLLNARGLSATAYHSQITPVVRRDNLRLFRRGVFDVLVSCRALDEGVNIPETTLAVVASSTASTRQRIQRLGRVLRPAPGKRHAVIYTLYATDVERRRLTSEEASLEGVASVSWLDAAVDVHG